MRGKPSGSVLPESTFVKIDNWLKKRKIMKRKFGLQHRRGLEELPDLKICTFKLEINER